MDAIYKAVERATLLIFDLSSALWRHFLTYRAFSFFGFTFLPWKKKSTIFGQSFIL